MQVNWTAIVASVAAALSAIFSLIGILVNSHYSQKTYKANVQNQPKLELLNSIHKLVPEYIAYVDYACYIYNKAKSNENDKKSEKEGMLEPGVKYGKTNFEDYDKALAKAKTAHIKLITLLKTQQNGSSLLKIVDELWEFIDTAKETFSRVTNARVLKEEDDFNEAINNKENELTKELVYFYKEQFEKLSK